MSYFQNVFKQDIILPILLADNQYSPNFKIGLNSGRGDENLLSWKEPPYDLSGNDADGDSNNTLTIGFAIDPAFKNWSYISINIATGAASASAVTPEEIVENLNGSATFADRFTAEVGKFKSGKSRVIITQTMPVHRLRSYIVRGRAETKLDFNQKAPVKELPSFFERHTIDNRFVDGSLGNLILLNPSSSDVDVNIIDAAGLDSGVVQADWQLFGGCSGLFTFKKQTVDGSNRITAIIEYPAGAVAGDFAKRTTYTYSGVQTSPLTIAEVPYVLQSGDLITP